MREIDMIVKEKGIEIPDENPFENDKLNLELVANNLEKIIESFSGGFVLSIDAGWGKGKTTFINMWKKKLDKSRNYKTIYFNAWENDDSDDPLLALIGEMERVLFKNNLKNKALKNIKKFGKHLVKKGIPVAIKIATSGIVDLKGVELGAKNEQYFTDLAGTIGEFELNNYKREKDNKNKFKEALKEYQNKERKKIIFFIDELDRCKPTYAIETLEKIKHLFDIDNYVFILSMDKEQLGHSVCNLYGSNMDASGYLRRFIDLDYTLPEPNKYVYIKILFEKYQLINDNTEALKQYLIKAVEVFDLSLRDIEKLFYCLRLILPLTPFFDLKTEWNKNYLKTLSVLFSLFIVLKLKKPNLYNQYRRKTINKTFAEEIRLDKLSSNDNLYKDIVNRTINMYVNNRKGESDNIVNGFEHHSIMDDGIFNLINLYDKDRQDLTFLKQIDFIDEFKFDE